MDGVRGSVMSADGTRIGTLTGGIGPPLLLVHGGLLGLSRWGPLWEQLTPRFQVTALDRRGRGSSGDGPGYMVDREYEDVAAVAAHLAGRAEDEVDVLGHSFGGVCVLGAVGLGAPIRRVALYEPPGPATVPAVWRQQIKRHIAAGEPGAAVVSFLVEIVGLSVEDVMALRNEPGTDDVLAIAARTLPRESDALAELDLPDLAGQVRHPVLLMLGTLSPLWAGEVTRSLVQLLPDAELVTIPGHGHEGADTAAEAVARALYHGAHSG